MLVRPTTLLMTLTTMLTIDSSRSLTIFRRNRFSLIGVPTREVGNFIAHEEQYRWGKARSDLRSYAKGPSCCHAFAFPLTFGPSPSRYPKKGSGRGPPVAITDCPFPLGLKDILPESKKITHADGPADNSLLRKWCSARATGAQDSRRLAPSECLAGGTRRCSPAAPIQPLRLRGRRFLLLPTAEWLTFIAWRLPSAFEKIREMSAIFGAEACHKSGEWVVVRLVLVSSATRSATAGLCRLNFFARIA
jgi:hypothetical protein